MGLEGSTWAVVAQSAVLKLENERQQLNPQRTGRVGWEEGACRTHCVETVEWRTFAQRLRVVKSVGCGRGLLRE